MLIDMPRNPQSPGEAYLPKRSRLRLFERLIGEFPRQPLACENAGLIFQAIAYGYFKSDRPHLHVVVDKVRTGSSRQRRFGDLDLYSGLELALSVEVKDLRITKENLNHQLGLFMKKAGSKGLPGLIFVADIDVDAAELLSRDGFHVLAAAELVREVGRWDEVKQDNALNGVLHYLSNVEQNPDAVTRVLRFVEECDSSNPLLLYLNAQ